MFTNKKLILNLVLVAAYFVSAGASLYAVLSSPLGEIYVNMPREFLPLYLLATFILLVLITYSQLGTSHKILLIAAHALVSHVYFSIQFYPSIGGDPWVHLAYEKSIEKGWFSTYVVLEQTSILTQIYMAVRNLAQYLLVITLSNIFTVDIYWVHILFMPVLWSIFVPPIAFAVAKEIRVDEKTSLLAAFLGGMAPTFIGWGSITVPNSLGFLFFFFSLYCFLKSISEGGRRYLILALLSAGLSFFAHFMAGVAFLSLFFVYAASRMHRQNSVWVLTSVQLTLIAVLTMPLALVVQGFVYPIKSFFSLNKFHQYDAYQLLLTDYASMSGPELLTNGALLILGIIGIFLLYRKKNGKNRAFLVVSFLTFVFQYLYLFYFIDPVPFSPRRLWGFRDLVLTPFAAVAVTGLLDFAWGKKAVYASANPMRMVKSLHLGTYLRKMFFALLILVSLSLLVSDGLLRYYNYERYFTPGGRITTAELEAIYAIQDEYFKTNENYVVVSDRSISTWGAGVVGAFNPHQVYLIWEDTYFRQLFQNPAQSQSILSQAVGFAETRFNESYGLVYFIASKPLTEFYTRKSYEDLVSFLAGNFDTFYVSPDNEIQVFVWAIPFFPHVGFGPEVQVTGDGISTSLRTNYYYETRDNVRYYLTLNGSSEYTVINWPTYWRFETIRPLPINRSIDANVWINFTTTPEKSYVIEWVANEFYKDKVIWRDDSFATGWTWYFAYGGLEIGNFSSDGSIGRESVSGLSEYYAMFKKEIPLVQNATSLFVRLEGAGTSQFSVSLFDANGREVYFVSWETAPDDYEEFEYTLPEGLSINYISLNVRTLDGSLAIIYWDYLALFY